MQASDRITVLRNQKPTIEHAEPLLFAIAKSILLHG